MRRSIARRSSLHMSLLSAVGAAIIAIISYQSICMWQEMRHQETLDRASEAIEQVLMRDGFQTTSEMWRGVDELLLSLGNVRAKVHAENGQVLYGPQILLSQVKHKVTAMYPVSGVAGFMPMHQLELAMDVSEDHRFLNFIALLFAAVTVVWALLVMLLSGPLARLELRPLNRFGRKIAAFDPSDLSARIGSDHEPQELYPVIEQFNRLMGKVGHYHEQLRSFNSNVAHELNTPLSSLTVSHELLLREKELDPALHREALHSHLEELQRMNRIIQSMLFLSHASQGGQSQFELVRQLSAPALTVIDYMEAMLEDKELQVLLTGEASVHADLELIKRAVSNLLSNAIRYANPASTIRVSIHPNPTEQLVYLTVSNQGPSIPRDSLFRLFEPFYRVDSARNQSDRNHGLGLAIVAAIAKAHGGEPFARCEGDWVHIGFSMRLG
jgi:two-component system, OmpR family, heavy metal sensor histidine kinase CusS